MDKDKLTQTWKEYERGKDYLQLLGRYAQADQNHNFYIGKQWEGLKSGDMPMPVKNFIKPICDYKIGVASQNTLSAVFTSANLSDEDLMEVDGKSFKKTADKVFKLLTKYVSNVWEHNNMDAIQWDIIKDACVGGDIFAYSYLDNESNEKVELIDDSNIYFSDENNSDIQDQDYILITFRRPVSQIKEIAEEKGLSKAKIDLITSDEETTEQTGIKDEVQTDNGKCLCILKLYKKKNRDGKLTVHMTKSTKMVDFYPEEDTNLTLYPISKYGWIPMKNSIRCMGEPEPMINNQIEVNKTLARRSIAVTLGAYPKLAYLQDKITNPSDLNKVGIGIGINSNTAEDVNKAITYLRPAQISPDAKALNDELVQDTRELAGAGDVALGITNPEQASGRSIIAVRDNATLPLNSHISRYRKFVEDLVRIWFDMWQNQSGIEGKRIVIEEPTEEIKELMYGKIEQEEPSLVPSVDKEPYNQYPDEPIVEVIDYTVLQRLKANVRIDVTNANPYSKYAEEQSLEALYSSDAITFEEYVELLPSDSITPKDKLEQILDDRKKKTESITNMEKEMYLKKQEMEQVEALKQLSTEPMLEDSIEEPIMAEDYEEEINNVMPTM